METGTKFILKDIIDYVDGGVASRQVMKQKDGNVTVFSFTKEDGLSEHSAPYDALVQILEGETEILIDGKPHELTAGECIILPAHVPHALRAVSDFKMMLVMIKSDK